MKTKALPIIAIAICVSGALALTAAAESGHDQAAVAGQHHDADKQEAKGPASTTSPAEVMKQIHELHTKLAATVSEKKLEDVHHLAFAIRDLAATLPPTFQSEKQVKVAATVTNISSIASALDESGDAKDQLKTEANLKKLDGLVKMLESQVSNT